MQVDPVFRKAAPGMGRGASKGGYFGGRTLTWARSDVPEVKSRSVGHSGTCAKTRCIWEGAKAPQVLNVRSWIHGNKQDIKCDVRRNAVAAEADRTPVAAISA